MSPGRGWLPGPKDRRGRPNLALEGVAHSPTVKNASRVSALSLHVLAERHVIPLEVGGETCRIEIDFPEQPLIAGVRRVLRSGVVLLRGAVVVPEYAYNRRIMRGGPVTISE